MTFQVMTDGLCHSKGHETRADAEAEIATQAQQTVIHIAELMDKAQSAQEYQDSLTIIEDKPDN